MKIFSTLILLIFSQLAFGQQETSPSNERNIFGLTANANFTTISNFSNSIKLGGGAGLFAIFGDWKPTGLYVEVSVQRNNAVRSTDTSKPQVNFTSVDIPFALRFRLADRFYLHGGFRAKILTASSRPNFIREVIENHVGVLLGTEIVLNDQFHLLARYSVGITDIGKEYFLFDDDKTNAISSLDIGFGVRFN